MLKVHWTAFAVVLGTACSSTAGKDSTMQNSQAVCAYDGGPEGCPSVQPSYMHDVVPILNAKCNNCHTSTDGGDGPWPLTDYQLLADWRTTVLQTLHVCSMPPLDGGTTLTDEERNTLTAWLVCGAHNN